MELNTDEITIKEARRISSQAKEVLAEICTDP